jgi:hypothetical protein
MGAQLLRAGEEICLQKMMNQIVHFKSVLIPERKMKTPQGRASDNGKKARLTDAVKASPVTSASGDLQSWRAGPEGYSHCSLLGCRWPHPVHRAMPTHV